MARYRGLALAKNRSGLDTVFVIQISESAIADARLRVKSFMDVRPFRIKYHLRDPLYYKESLFIIPLTISAAQFRYISNYEI